MDTKEKQHEEIKDALEELCRAQKKAVESFEKHAKDDLEFQKRIEPYLQEFASLKGGALIIKWIVLFLASIGSLYFMFKGITK